MNLYFVDIDNTIANTNEQLKLRGVRTDIYPSPVPAGLWNDLNIFKDAAPLYHMIDFIDLHKQTEGQVFYLTARPFQLLEVTLEWLRKHNLPVFDIVFSEGRSKGEVIQNYVCSQSQKKVTVIEDAPGEIESILTLVPEANLVIPDWPYNRHILDGYRVYKK